ncbi:MAG: hypothetical protein M0021_11360 [Clostridia bacterium]|nr:hypothetical protein [Clostridia bacterium]
MAETDEDWHYLITKLNAGSKEPGDYRKRLVMEIYRDHLRDDAAFLKERLAWLKYGTDYYELVVFYQQKGETSRAVELAEEGLAKGEGRVADLIDFLLNHFQSLNDYVNSLRLYRRAFLDKPGLAAYQDLKTFAHAADWPTLEKECLEILSVKSRKQELAKIHLAEKRYDEVLKFVQEANPGWPH